MKVVIRPSIAADIAVFFENQTDDEANMMAAFTPANPHDKEGYISKWLGLMVKDSINMQTVLVDDEVVGCIVKFEMEGDVEITYAIDKNYWGKGVTTIGMQLFLETEKARPIHGRVAFDNIRSQKILEKTGFIKVGTDRAFANARGKEIEEFIYRLDL